jgi:hypothetical protein
MYEHITISATRKWSEMTSRTYLEGNDLVWKALEVSVSRDLEGA